MASILISDSDKLSIIMTTECCKDKRKNLNIHIVTNGSDCLNYAKSHAWDLIIVDFDLPDCDGMTLTKRLRKFYLGPILISAFPDTAIEHAIRTEFFAYPLDLQLIHKPLRIQKVSPIIGELLQKKLRITKRFLTNITTTLTKKRGRGHRLSRVEGTITNFSLGGAMIEAKEDVLWKQGEVINMLIDKEPKLTGKKKVPKKNSNKYQQKILSKIIWVKSSPNKIGIKFEKLTIHQRKSMLTLLQDAEEIPA